MASYCFDQCSPSCCSAQVFCFIAKSESWVTCTCRTVLASYACSRACGEFHMQAAPTWHQMHAATSSHCMCEGSEVNLGRCEMYVAYFQI